MIRKIQINLSAEHPEIPLIEGATFVGSPSAVFVSGVPQAVGSWRITSVKVVATYPDDSAPTVECVKGADGVYVATIPATATSGRVTNGLQIIADGIDERGEPVTGYVLGMADFAVYLRDMTIEGATGVKYYLHLLDAPTDDPKEGDAYLDGSTLAIYHDGEWTEIAGGGYEPPPGGIPKTDLSAGVQASLDKADSALQTAPVTRVNGKTGAVTLTASDVGALGNIGDQTLNGGTLLIDNNGPDTELNLTGIQGDVRIENWGGEYRVSASQQNPNARWYWPGLVSPKALARLYDVMRFSENRGYLIGDIVFYNGGLYRCVAALHSGAWNDNAFELVLGGLSTGRPTAPTPTAQSEDTQVANKKYVDDAIAGATPNLDYVMRVDPETGGIYYTTPDTNA